MKFLRLLMLLFATVSFAYAQQSKTSGIRGKITTSDGHEAAFVSVKLVGKPLGATTNNKGEYEINKVKAGTYTIRVSAVGLTSQEKAIEVTESAFAEIDFVLNEDLSTLEEVNISANSKKYKVDKPSSSLRLDQPLLEIPQNVQIVTSSALADQQVISMSDGVLRNVSGAVRLEHWGDLYANVLMRGSQLQAFRNGFNVVSSFWGPLTEDMSFVDHIEFVKGPSGFMLANGDPAGLYNVVTKKPTGQTRGEISMTLGSYDLYRTSLDLDGKLSADGRLLYRLNVAGQNKKTHRANEFNNRYTFAPVLSYQIDEQTKLTAEYTLQYAKMSDIGSYYLFSNDGYGSLPINATSLQPGLEPTKIKDHSAFVNLEHKLDDHWKVTAQVAYLRYIQGGSSMWPADVNADGTLIRNVGIWDADSEMALGQAFLNGNLQTGSVQHRILAGLDIGSKDYMADWGQSHNLDLESNPFSYEDPNYGLPENGYPQFNRTQGLGARAVAAGGIIDQRYSGIYVQDELGFLENRIRLTLAGRYSKVTQSEWGGEPQTSKKFTPRIGLSISIDKQLSVYGLYDQAFIPQSGRLSNGQKIKPITGGNLEFGLKKDWFDGKWNTTLSAYRIIKNHELTSVGPPANPLSIELGEKRARGIDFDLRGEIFEGLNATINYAYTDAKITQLDSRVEIFSVGDPVP
ncbi:MAG TPA: carboxypeptidase-like regulatory domain-containing protein, partial [Pedobacter sp.]|nr:carboxypeptidase-like regulatory domain-containing protein [Pedobacter sp.]